MTPSSGDAPNGKYPHPFVQQHMGRALDSLAELLNDFGHRAGMM
jgi:hypothetical protein